MRSFFDRKVKEFYPRGTHLVDLAIYQHGHFAFKSAVSYVLTLLTPAGRRVTRIIRGNVSSKDMAIALAIGTDVQKQLYQHGFAFGQYRVPLSLGFYPRLRLGVYENFPGTPVASYIAQGARAAIRAAGRAGHWLARLHQSPVRARLTRHVRQLRSDDQYFIDNFRRGYPAALGSIRALVGVLEKRLSSRLRRQAHATITHGDFHLANIIVHPSGAVGVIDFGNCSMFDPLSDVGSFLAQTDRCVWDRQLSANRARKIQQAFVAAYCRERKLRRSALQPTLDYFYCWWIVQLLAYSAIIRSSSARKRLTRHGLAACAAILKKHGQVLPVTDIRQTRTAAELRRQLTNPQTMLDFFSAHLAQCLPDANHIERVTINQPKALSQTSFLTRYTIKYFTRNNQPATAILRGNFIPPATYRLLSVLATQSNVPLLQPLMYVPKPSYFVYREVPGKRFREIPPRRRDYKNILRAIATTVASLHREPVVGAPWTLANERRFIRQCLAVIRRRDRRHAVAATALAVTLLRSSRAPWTRQTVTTHGDLQGSNIIIGPDRRAWLIDFTLTKRFHPAHDVATFITHLDIMLLKTVSAGQRRRFRDIFLRQYYKKVGPPASSVVQSALAYHVQRAALDIIAITVTNLGPRDPNRRTYVEHLLATSHDQHV